MSKWLPYIIIVALLVFIFKPRTPIIEVKETVKVVTKDSIVRDTIRDTIFAPPIIIDSIKTDTLRFRDSIFVPIPISQYTFQDSTYKFTLSGWNVKPISMEVYPTTVYEYETVTKEIETIKQKRLNFGATAGLTILHTSDGLRSGIGATIGLTYNF